MPDYFALAKQFGAVSSHQDEPSDGSVDYEALARQFGGQSERSTPRRPVSAEDFIPQDPAKGSAVGRYFSNLGETLNPITMVKGAVQAVTHPIDTVSGIVKSHAGEFTKAKEAYDQGRLSEAVGHGTAAVLPVLGPMAAAIGEQAGRGDVAGAAGKLAGLVAPVAAVKIAPAALRVPGALRNPNPLAAEAVDMAVDAGLPIDVGTATNNRFLSATQHLSDRTLGGGLVAGNKIQAQAKGLATLGEQLAAKGHTIPVTSEQAGEAVRDAVMSNIKAHNATADAGYNVLRKIEANPAFARPVKMPDGSVQMMPLPVNIASARKAFQPIYEELSRQSAITPASFMGDKARALNALDLLMNGKRNMHGAVVAPASEFVPLSVADSLLSDLKSFSRTDVPELRSAGQGAVAETVKHLDQQVRQTAASAGPLADAALRTGRNATIAKYASADVLDSLAAEPVRTMKRLTAPDDTAIEQLRAVHNEAPQVLPQMGRAYLDDLLGQATSEGAFGHAKAIAAKWEKLGTRTKLLLYKDPAYITDLDRFFQLAKMAAETPNPSGTAHTLLTAGQGGLLFTDPLTGTAVQLGGAALSGLLHSRRGVQLLTRGFKIPIKNTAESAAWVAGVNAATSPSGSQMRTAPAR